MHLRLLGLLLTVAALTACRSPADTGPRSCTPSCLTRQCGPDGCGASCGSCGCGSECRDGRCMPPVAGTWEGFYNCNQGRTALTLKIDGSGDQLDATFNFKAHPFNPGVPSGAFRMSGEFDCKNGLQLEPRQWLDQPTGYVMVGLDGQLADNGRTIAGQVDGSGCSVFKLYRRGDEAAASCGDCGG